MTNNRFRRSAPTAPARAPRDRRGFALPMAILVIAFLTVTISAAYTATSSELTTNMAQRGESKAYMIAQAGPRELHGPPERTGLLRLLRHPAHGDVRVHHGALPNGYAQVVAQRVRVGSDKRPAIYLLRVQRHRHRRASRLSAAAGSAKAERTVAQLVYWNVNQVNVLSGWTSTSGLDKQGSSGTISGVDESRGKGYRRRHRRAGWRLRRRTATSPPWELRP